MRGNNETKPNHSCSKNQSPALTRRAFLKAAAAATLGAAFPAPAAWSSSASSSTLSPSNSEKPNFVFILVDDLRHDAIAAAGNPLIQTPAMDSLAARGILFKNAFVTCSICSPSRAACLTGRYGSANGVMKLDVALNPGERTFAHAFKEAGYATAHIGKWHLRTLPQDCGFDVDIRFQSNGPYRNRRITNQGQPETVKGYIDEDIARRAVRFIDAAQQSGKPFALFFCTQAPHMPWDPKPETLARYKDAGIEAPATWRDDLSGKPPYLRTARFRTRARQEYRYDTEAGIIRHIKQYYATVTELDAAIAPLIRRLERDDLRRNTTVILIGDNGWQMGEHGLTSKVLPYETSIRVPLVIAGPATRRATEERFVLNIDLPPTMLDLAGLPIPPAMHGRSLAGVVQGRTAGEARQDFLYEALEPELESWPLLAVRTRRHKYIQTFDITDRARCVFEELYDLESDPAEMKNLAADPAHADLKADLKRKLERLRDEIRKGT